MEPEIVDVLVLLAVFLFVVDGLRRGVLAAVVDLVALVLAFAIALSLFGRVSDLILTVIELPRGIATAAGFMIVWVVAQTVLSVVGAVLIGLVPGFLQRSLPSRILAVAPRLLHGLVIAALVLAFLVAMPLPTGIRDAILDSTSGRVLIPRTSAVTVYLNEIFGGAVQDTLNLLSVRPESDERVDLNFRVAEPVVDEAAEDEMLRLVNEERARARLRPLQLDTGLRDVAREYARDMFQRGFFAHIDPDGRSPADRMRAGNVRFLVAGENLALAPTVQIAHLGLMNSAGHRANILSPNYGRLGVGVMDGGRHGKMFVQNFAD